MTQAEMIAAAVAKALAEVKASGNVGTGSTEFAVEKPSRVAFDPGPQIDSSVGLIAYMRTTPSEDPKTGKRRSKPSYWVTFQTDRGSYAKSSGDVVFQVRFLYSVIGDEVPVKSLPVIKFLYECWQHPEARKARVEQHPEARFPESWAKALVDHGLAQ